MDRPRTEPPNRGEPFENNRIGMDQMSIDVPDSRSQARASLTALQSQVGRLMLVQPVGDSSSMPPPSTLNALAWQLSGWVSDAGRRLKASITSQPPHDVRLAVTTTGEECTKAPLPPMDTAAAALADTLISSSAQLSCAVERFVTTGGAPDETAELWRLIEDAKTQLGTTTPKLYSGAGTRFPPRPPPGADNSDPVPLRTGSSWKPEQHVDKAANLAPTKRPWTGDNLDRPAHSFAQPPDHDPADSRTQAMPRLELHRLDDAERVWWQKQFINLRRRVSLGLSIPYAILAGIWVLTSWQPEAGQTSSVHGSAPSSPTAHLERRVSELEVAVMRLNAELATLESAGAAALNLMEDENPRLNHSAIERGIANTAGANAFPPSDPAHTRSALDTSAQHEPEPMAAELQTAESKPEPRVLHQDSAADNHLTPTQPSAVKDRDPSGIHDELEPVTLDHSTFVIQLAAFKHADRATIFIRQSGIKPSRLYIEITPRVHIVMLGFFADQSSAETTLAALPEHLRSARPIVRVLDADRLLFRVTTP